jgi:hypothetical protein
LREVSVAPPADGEDLEVVTARYMNATEQQADIIRCARTWYARLRVLYATAKGKAIKGRLVDCERRLGKGGA